MGVLDDPDVVKFTECAIAVRLRLERGESVPSVARTLVEVATMAGVFVRSAGTVTVLPEDGEEGDPGLRFVGWVVGPRGVTVTQTVMVEG